MQVISLVVVLLVSVNILYFSVVTLCKITGQREAVIADGNFRLIPTINSRLILYLFVTILQFVYFGGQILEHIVFAEESLKVIGNENTVDFEKELIAEISEATIVVAMFVLLRARSVDQFYYSEIHLERTLPFYHGDTKHWSDGVLLVKFPRRKFAIGIPAIK